MQAPGGPDNVPPGAALLVELHYRPQPPPDRGGDRLPDEAWELAQQRSRDSWAESSSGLGPSAAGEGGGRRGVVWCRGVGCVGVWVELVPNNMQQVGWAAGGWGMMPLTSWILWVWVGWYMGVCHQFLGLNYSAD